MNESEAKKKWCPMARLGSYAGSAYNRDREGNVGHGVFCLGKGCMLFVSMNKQGNDDRYQCSLGVK